MRHMRFLLFAILLTYAIPVLGYQQIDSNGSRIIVSYNRFFYKVKNGDSLVGIAKKFGLTVKKLKRLNHIKTGYIRANDVLIIAAPDRKNLYIRQKSVNSSILAYTNSYMVKKGDTLFSISKRFSTSVKLLRKFNHLRGFSIKAGQKLLVPSETPFVSYRLIPVNKLVRKIRLKIVRHDRLHLFQSSRYRVVKIAEKYLGVPYKFGGESFKSGIDCSAFVMEVFRKINLRLPRTTGSQYRYGIKIPKSSLRVGDLVFFNTRRGPHSHVGIYIGHNKFIHASSGRVHSVTISRLTGFYKRHFGHAVRVIKR